MKRLTILAIVLASILAMVGCTSERYARYERERPSKPDTLALMKKQDIVTLSKAGVSDSLIITMMETSDSWFQLKTQDVVELKNAGVSDKVINAMIESNEPMNDAGSPAVTGYAYNPYYYWYPGYYPYWYYPSFYFGYRYSPSVYMRGSIFPHRSSFGGYGHYGGRRGGGRRR